MNQKNLQRLLTYAATAGYLILALVTVAWGVYKRFQVPQAPIVDPDIRGYLGPAMSALTGHGFIHMDGRSFPYPWLVYLILKCFGDFRAISVIQHVLGAGAGVLLLLAWNALLKLVPPGGIPREISRFIGVGPAAIFLGSATAIHFEQEIRPEAIFPFLTILNLYISLLFLDARFVRKNRSALWLGGLNIFIAYLIYLMKPSFGLALPLTTAPVWLSLLLPGQALRQKGILLAAAVIPASLLLFLPEHILKRGDIWGTEFLPETLFSVHASMILEQMEHDLAANDPTPYPRQILQSAHDLLAADLKKAATVTTPKAFDSLGYNPDYLMYNTFCPEFAKMTGWDPAQTNRFYYYYYERVLTKQPGAMWKKIIGQMRLFYGPKNPAYRLGQSLKVADEYARNEELITKRAQIGAGYAPLQPYFQECNALAAKGASFDQIKRLTEWTRLFSAHYMDLLWVAIISPLVLISCALRKHLRWVVIGLWLVYSYNFGNCFTIAVVHSLEVTRYVRIQLIYTVLAQTLSLYFIAEALVYGVRVIAQRRVHR
ncbi:MAG TPA: hypothetical protein VHY22_13105 [Chthoniobacteraceae bacterium]|jgi:hypothetical protein|nr:hypothetical protein [Chthoniobacteraceae bacterium]